MVSLYLTALLFTSVESAPVVNARPIATDSIAAPQKRVSADYSRRMAWEAYSGAVERLEKEYRNAGFTPAARQRYQAQLKRLQLYYVFETP